MSATAEWTAFLADASAAHRRAILDLFAAEPDRLEVMTVQAAGLTVDLSKQPWSVAGLRARSIASRSTPSGAVKARRMKKLPVSRSQNWLDSEMLALSAASSVVTAATMPGRSAQLSVKTKLAGTGRSFWAWFLSRSGVDGSSTPWQDA